MLTTRRPRLDEFIRSETPFDNWREFLTAAYQHEAAPDEIAALLDREFQEAWRPSVPATS